MELGALFKNITGSNALKYLNLLIDIHGKPADLICVCWKQVITI